MRLSDKITEMEKEVGLTVMLCFEFGCPDNTKTQSKGNNYGSQHCRQQIPYVKSMGEGIKLLELCEKRIEAYWKR